MKETVKPLRIEEAAMNKVKGKTTIILTSVKDGSKKVIEHENTFQSAVLARQLRALGKANASPFNNNTWAGYSLWRNLVGGIFLFRDAIDISGGDVAYMPAGNLMVANGSYGVSNSGNPPELGSYNSIESATSGSNSISFVYDWTTAQGNGTIGCVCLTSETGGYIGYGNDSGEVAATKYYMFRNQTASAPGGRFFYNGKRYSVSAVDLTAKKVTISEGTDRFTVASIFQDQNAVDADYTFTGSAAGYSSTGSYIYVKSLNAEEFAIIAHDSYSGGVTVANNATANVLVFNCRTKTLRLQPIVNTTGRQQYLLQASTNRGINLAQDANGNYYIADQGSTYPQLYKFDSNGVYVGVAATHANNTSGIGRLTPELLHMTPDTSGGSSYPMWIYDGTDERPTNGYISTTMGNNIDYCDALDVLLQSVGGSASRAPYKNPLYLATVNNLQSAVVKDATQTMKVIYTLTEA